MAGFGFGAWRTPALLDDAPPPSVELAPLTLAPASLREGSAPGSPVGAVSARTSGGALSLVEDAGGRFALAAGSIVAGLVATNYETGTSHSITIRETLAGATNSPRDTVLTIAVTNIFEQPDLGALGLSATSFTNGTPASGAIIGATAGSAITASSLPSGLAINGAARSWAWSGTGTVGSSNIALTEALADSANSPRVSGITITIAAPGPITAAAVEASGTVLALTLSGVSAGSWASYPIDAQSKMALTLAASGAGFDRSGGQAQANAARTRSLVALKPCRRAPIVPTGTSTPNANVLDERDNGDGTRTIRLRLSRYVYAGETCSLAALADWRSGASAQAGVAVTNNSAVAAAPVIGGRWLTPPNQRVTGTFRVDLMAASLHPEGLSGLAAVRFDVTDGTTTKSFWAAAPSTSTAYGDSVRCWGADIDPSGLNPGLITVHKTIFPWIGPSRTSGSGQSTASGSFVTTADAPLVMAYDPAGTRYPAAWVVCDPVNGTATASAAMVQTSLAAAKAIAAASKPISVACAIQALYLANRSATAANGQAALTRMTDGATIVLPAGTTQIGGSTAITTGITSTECWPTVIGDPDDPNPRANCILESSASTPNLRINRLAFRNLRMNVGGSVMTGVANLWLDNVQVEAKSGQGASTLFLNTQATSFIYVTKSAIGSSTVVNWGNTGNNQRFALVRSSSTPRNILALAIVNCDCTAMSGWTGGTDAASQADWVAMGNRMLSSTSTAVTWPTWSTGTYGECVRALFINNLAERIGADPSPFWAIGENSLQRFTHVLIEGNSMVGERSNTLYNDPPDLVNDNIHVDCRVANNYFDWLPTKQDDFYDDTTVAGNGGAPNYGYRPWLTANLWFQDGTNCEANVLARRTGGANFPQGPGLAAVVNPSTSGTQGNAWSKFVADRSVLGDGTGGGDYRPGAGSPLIGAATRANIDVDRAGTARGATFASGALEAA